jgi:hypothetical protein
MLLKMLTNTTDELEDFTDEFEKFNLERSKRRLINSLIQGAAFKGGHMYVLVSDELERMLILNLLNLIWCYSIINGTSILGIS